MGGPCPGPSVSMGNSGHRQSLGQMVRSRALATVHQMHQLTLSCLTMAPSIMSQWNQRKLAPNYRLLSVKNRTGADGVCQRAEDGWWTHCGTEACSLHIEHTQAAVGGDTSDYTHARKPTQAKRLNLHSLWLICASAGSAPSPPHEDATTETTCVPSLIQQD